MDGNQCEDFAELSKEISENFREKTERTRVADCVVDRKSVSEDFQNFSLKN